MNATSAAATRMMTMRPVGPVSQAVTIAMPMVV